MAQNAAKLKPDAVIADKYRVLRTIGGGGMGFVVAAEHTILKQTVALKFLNDVSNEEDRERFFREARAAARLESQHICRVMDVGTLPDGTPFIVMELLSGIDLAGRLAAYGPMPAHEAADLLLEALDALVEAHARGIVHRDLKPSNLFLARRSDGTTMLKVLDFGISKLDPSNDRVLTLSTQRSASPESGSRDAAMTDADTIMGSPPYMSPEQFRSARDVDARTDIWSLGVILYELVAGRRPFQGAGPEQLFAAIAAGEYVPLDDVRPEAPPGLARVVDGCLRVDPEQRYAHAADLAEAIARFASAGAVARLERVRRFGAATNKAPDEPAPTLYAPLASPRARLANEPAPTTRSRRTVWIVGIVTAVLGLAVGGQHPIQRLLASRERTPAPPAPSASSSADAGAPTLPPEHR